MSKNIAVIGSGIAGVTSAYYLAKKGYQVTVYEQESYPAMRCSYANGGQISVSNSEVWTTYGNVKKGLKWMFKKDAPLLIRPRLDIAQWKWILKFLYHTIKGSYKQNTEETIRMGNVSNKLYEEICKEENIEDTVFDKTHSGILHFYKNNTYFDNAKLAKELYDANNCEWKILDKKQVYNKDNKLRHIKNIVGGAWTSTDWTGDIHKFTNTLADICKTKYSVVFKFDEKIINIKELLNKYDAVVISAGVNSVNLAKQVGDTLDIYPVKGYSITIDNVDKKYLPTVSLLDDEAKIVTSSLGNRFRVAGTAELNGENYDIVRSRIEPLLKWVKENFPNIDTRNYKSWACLRPMTPNMMPITKRSDKHSKVFYNTGHGHLGWTLAPFTAKLLSELI